MLGSTHYWYGLQDAARLARGACAGSRSARQGHHDSWHDQRAQCRESKRRQVLLRLSFQGRKCTSSIILSSARKAPATSPIDVQHCVVSHLQFAGYGSWKTQWSHEHQRYCCYKFKEACVTKAGISLKISWFGIATRIAGLRLLLRFSTGISTEARGRAQSRSFGRGMQWAYKKRHRAKARCSSLQ